MKTIKRKFKLIIEIDEEKLKKEYPNFDINYLTIREFIDMAILETQVDNLKEIEYKIIIEKEVKKWKQFL